MRTRSARALARSGRPPATSSTSWCAPTRRSAWRTTPATAAPRNTDVSWHARRGAEAPAEVEPRAPTRQPVTIANEGNGRRQCSGERARAGLVGPAGDEALQGATPAGRVARLVRGTRQFDGERRSRPGVLSTVDRAPQRIDDLLDDPETQADAAVVAAGRGPLEASEDAFVVVRRDAEAAIADRDAPRRSSSASSVTSIGLQSPYLIALDTRFVTTWSRRLLSQRPTTAAGARTFSVRPHARRLRR